MHLLIDADSLIYKATAPCDTKMYIVSDEEGKIYAEFPYKKDMMKWLNAEPKVEELTWEHIVTEVEPVENALHNLKVKLQLILEKASPDSYELFLTKGDNFRHDLAKNKPYKGTRGAKPTHFQAGFDYLIKHWGAEYTLGLEADDVVAMKMHENEYASDVCVAHIDKDIDTVKGLHFNFDTYEFYELSRHEALANYYRQFLIGDSSDNIEGVKGIGKVNAAKLIKPTMHEWEMFDVICTKFKYNNKLILETGRLLHMTRQIHLDGSPFLWEFPEHG